MKGGFLGTVAVVGTRESGGRIEIANFVLIKRGDGAWVHDGEVPTGMSSGPLGLLDQWQRCRPVLMQERSTHPDGANFARLPTQRPSVTAWNRTGTGADKPLWNGTLPR